MKRRGIIAALVGLLPVLQRSFGQNLTDNISALTVITDPYVEFNNGAVAIVRIGWDIKAAQLVVKADGREARMSVAELMDALEAK